MATATLTTTLSRLLTPTTTTTTTLRLSSVSLPLLRRRQTPRPLRLSTSTRISATIAVGDTLPDSTLSYLDAAGEVQTVTVSALTKGKKAVLFAVPGAFTPTCSQKHLPGFVEKSSELRAKGVDTIACVSVNDVFVMRAWKEDLKIGDEVLLLSDGNGDFTRAIGCELDLRDKPVGLGVGLLTRGCALIVSRPSFGACRDDMRFYVRDLVTRMRVGDSAMKRQALASLHSAVAEEERYVGVVAELGDIIAVIVNFLDSPESQIREGSLGSS